eukprot:13834229-Alexandrium_andersonii.AAC.2
MRPGGGEGGSGARAPPHSERSCMRARRRLQGTCTTLLTQADEHTPLPVPTLGTTGAQPPVA